MQKSVSLTIDGMSCGHCVRAVDRALRNLPGIEVEQVAVGSAVVGYDPASVTPEQIEQVVTEEGYAVRGAGGSK